MKASGLQHSIFPTLKGFDNIDRGDLFAMSPKTHDICQMEKPSFCSLSLVLFQQLLYDWETAKNQLDPFLEKEPRPQ